MREEWAREQWLAGLAERWISMFPCPSTFSALAVVHYCSIGWLFDFSWLKPPFSSLFLGGEGGQVRCYVLV